MVLMRDIAKRNRRVEDERSRQAREKRHSQTEKMEALARLAGGLAHDMNNILTVISGYGQMMQDGFDRNVPKEKLQLYLTELMEAGGRAAVLTDELLTFSRKKVVHPRVFDLREEIESSRDSLRELLPPGAELTIELLATPCPIRADRPQISRALHELVARAAAAINDRGQVTVRARYADQIPVGLDENRTFVLLEVTDNGSGLDELATSRIFEPFFTIKSKRNARNLSSVYGIVTQSEGDVQIESAPEKGTTVRVFLPVSEESSVPRGPEKVRVPGAHSSRAVQRGTETVLLVEDDPAVRVLVKAMLERYGYRPIVADSGEDAIRLFGEHRSDIRLLLTDVIMPHMNGPEVARACQMDNPALKVLYISGYTADEVAQSGVSANQFLLPKPFSAEVLARRVREVLDDSA